MDLKNYIPTSTAPVRLIPPGTIIPSDTIIHVTGKDSAEYNATKHQIQNAVLSSNGKSRTMEEVKADTIRIIAECIKSWEELTENGEDVPCDMANKIRILTDFPWIREQVDEVIHDRAAFLPNALRN